MDDEKKADELRKDGIPCVRCNFKDEFIQDWTEEGKPYVFCGNCGEIKDPKKEETK